jgi:hypothetical protein
VENPVKLACTLARAAPAVTLLFVTPAYAADAERVRLSYDAPATCPTETEFLDTISRDGGRIVRPPDDEPARSFVVTVRLTESVVGQLLVRETDGTEAVRSIRGEHCDAVVRSLAALLTLSLKGDDAFRGDATPSDAPLEPPRTPVEAREGPVEPPAAPVDVHNDRWRFAASAAGTFPGVASGGAAYLEVFRDAPGAFAPSVRVGVGVGGWHVNLKSQPTTIALSGGETLDLGVSQIGSVGFATRIVRLDACPLRGIASTPWASDALTAQACGRFDGGEVLADSTSVPDFRPYRRLWAAAGALLRVRWMLPRYFFEIEGGATFPLTRERVFIEPATQGFEVPAVAPEVALGAGLIL